jgi:hypothetical protein
LSTAPQRLKVVIEKFVAKYGDKNIASYYPKKNAYVEVPTRAGV